MILRPAFRNLLRASVAFVVAGAVLVAPTTANAYPTDTITLSGHGFGHGRGLSQYGSLGYALGGANYQDILGRYYSNTAVGTLSPPNPGIDVRIVAGDGQDLIVVATNNYTVGGVSIPANYATRVTKTGANAFSIQTATNCAGGGGWVQVGTGSGTVQALPPSGSPGDNLNLMIQRCGTDTRAYRGALGIFDDNGTNRTINQVTLDDYLRGVIPRESPASWGDLGGGLGMNALKAQTVAARSYAVSSPSPRWNTCDTTACQVYGGVYLNGAFIEDARTNSAVSSTTGEIRTLNGATARTEFSSSSGGYTAGGTFPAVSDDGDSVSLNPNHNWTQTLSVNAIQAAYPSIGVLNNISVTARNGLGDDGGRVTSMVIAGASGSVTVSGADFRSRLGLKSDWFSIQNTPSGGIKGYWMTAPDGGVFSFGNAPFYGSTGALRLARPIVGLASKKDNGGYWLVASDGGVFAFGSAPFYGSTGNIRLNQPVVGIGAKPDASGYWLVARDGGVFSFGNAPFYGSTGNIRLNQPIVGMAPTPSGNGYWLVAADGGIFSFGDASFFGSTGNIRLSAPISGMAATPSGKGYWLVATDGGVFAFGDARYQGSLPGSKVTGQQASGIFATASGTGYVISTLSGQAYNFGDAPQFGGVANAKQPILGIAPVYQ